MKKIVLLAVAILVSASFATVSAKKKKKKVEAQPVPIELKSSSDSISYAAGMAFTNGLFPYLKQQFGVDSAHIADFVKGYEEAVKMKGDTAFKARMAGFQISQMVYQRMLPSITQEIKNSPDSIVENAFQRGFCDAISADHTIMQDSVAQAYFKSRSEFDKKAKDEKLYGANRKAGEAFLAANAKKDSVVTLPDGLQYKILVQGTGKVPQKTDKVVVKYEGKLIDGTVFDSSERQKGKTATFRADQVIKGWTEALTMMPVGSKWQLFIPQELAYGEREAGSKIKPFSALTFIVELEGIETPKTVVAPATKGPKAVKVSKNTNKIIKRK